MSEISKQRKIAIWLFTILALAYLIVETRGGLMHYHTEPWYGHNMFHVVTGLFNTQVLCIMVVVLAWIPFKNGERWSWWMILLSGISLHGGHVIGNIMTDGGLTGQQAAQGSGSMFYTLTVMVFIGYLIGCAITYKEFNK